MESPGDVQRHDAWFAAFYRETEPRVRRFLDGRGPHSLNVDDLVQDTFETLYRLAVAGRVDLLSGDPWPIVRTVALRRRADEHRRSIRHAPAATAPE